MICFYFSVQQCPSGNEDPTTQPDGINCELGTTLDHLPPAHHQLHGLLQLVEKRHRRRKDIQQDRGPEDGECHQLSLTSLLPLKMSAVLQTPPALSESGGGISAQLRWHVVMSMSPRCWLLSGGQGPSPVTHPAKNRLTRLLLTLTESRALFQI